MENILSASLLILLVLAPATVLYYAVSSLLFVPPVPEEPIHLYLRGYSQKGNTMCIYIQNMGKTDVNKSVRFVLRGENIHMLEVNLTLARGRTREICFDVPEGGSFDLMLEDGTHLGTISMFSIDNVVLTHGLSFGGVDKDRYKNVLFFGDHNKVIITTGSDISVNVHSTCTNSVTCKNSCVVYTNKYGPCTFYFYVSGMLSGSLDVNVLQFYECNSNYECREDLYKFDTSDRGVLLVHPEGVTDVSTGAGTFDANQNIVIDLNGEPFQRTQSPAISISLITNVEVTEVYLIPRSGEFWLVATTDTYSEPPYPITLSNSFIGGQLEVGYYSVSLRNVNIEDDNPINLIYNPQKYAAIVSSENSYCIADGDIWKIGTYTDIQNAVLSDKYCYLLIKDSNNVEVNGMFISKLDGIRVSDSNSVTLRSVVVTSKHGLNLFDSNNITLEDVNIFGEGPVVLSSCSGCETVLSVDLTEANSYILGSDTWVVDEGNLVVNCINCGNGFYLETNFDNNRISSEANFTVNCPYGTCCVYP